MPFKLVEIKTKLCMVNIQLRKRDWGSLGNFLIHLSKQKTKNALLKIEVVHFCCSIVESAFLAKQMTWKSSKVNHKKIKLEREQI